MFTIEPLFDFDPEPPPHYHLYPDDRNLIRLEDGSCRCRYCGEVSGNQYLHSNGHSYVFNGWCAARLMANHGANPDQLAWLEAHGFNVVNAHDPANWDLLEDAN